MRRFEELRQTTNNKVFKRLRKTYICGCPICGYHIGENTDGDMSGFKSWKLTSTRKKQWKKTLCYLH